jgi:lipopolysaccharide transport system ATP-binding protein
MQSNESTTDSAAPDSIVFQDVSIHFPVFNASTRSFRKRVIQVATGGIVAPDHTGHIVVQALTNLTFSIRSGERVAILGHNGAGKTTLLGALSRIYAPTSGKALITGSVGSLINISLGTDPESTGRENIFLRGAILGLERDFIKKKQEEIIDFSELGDFIDLPVRTYSSGMAMRLAFAVSTMLRPEIIVMDEWLSVGDKNFQGKAAARLDEMLKDTKILVLATHSRDLALRHCNRAIWLEHGRIKKDGLVKEVADCYFGA